MTSLVMGALTGCRQTVEKPPERDSGPTYTGPIYLRGTVGSVARLRGFQPLLVQGYGVVVNLDGTGSSEVPAFIRQQLINDLRIMGVGNVDSLLPGVSPQELLADKNTAVVQVQGFIPPGAVPGDRFDLLLTAADTQTTSLAGGDLWITDLSVTGNNPGVNTQALARGQGPVYIDPILARNSPDPNVDYQREVVVLAGGQTVEPRRLELVLNTPSYRMSRAVSDRINERYGAGVRDRMLTAEAANDLLIRINVPRDWAGRPYELLRLIEHLYLQRQPGFIPFQTRQLADVLAQRPDQLESVAYAWQSLGPNAVPELRNYYAEDRLHLRLAALEAGAKLGDERAGIELGKLATHPDPAIRIEVADALVSLPRSLAAARTLANLLDDEDQAVRTSAYQSLARINDPMVDRIVLLGPMNSIKFLLDLVPAESPFIYVDHKPVPTIALFTQDIPFDKPMLARLWNNRLMLRVSEPGGPLTVFYQPIGESAGETYDLAPTLSTLVFFLAHKPSDQIPEPGLNLSFSQTVDVLTTLSYEGHIDASIRAEISPLAQLISDSKIGAQDARPEITPLTGPNEDLIGPTNPDAQPSEEAPTP